MDPMLTQITTLTRNGLKDWFIQRISALVLMGYLLLIFGYILGHHPLQYEDWSNLFHHSAMRIFTILALLSLLAHTWVGIWTVITDYVKAKWIRGVLTVAMIVLLGVYFLSALLILWS
jgi:succinate dehydrogenase / fumarate reductase, membrane anchor subunit